MISLYNYGTTSNLSEDTTLSNYKNKAIIETNPYSSRLRVCLLNSKEDIDLPQNVFKDLDFKHNFSLHQSRSQKERVMFEPSLVLKKRSRPYHVELKAEFGCVGMVLIKTRETGKNKIKSPTGHVQIETQWPIYQISNISSIFAGIKDIELIYFPN